MELGQLIKQLAYFSSVVRLLLIYGIMSQDLPKPRGLCVCVCHPFDKGSCLKSSFPSAERKKTRLSLLMLTFLMQIPGIEQLVYCLVDILGHLCSAVEVFTLCSCSCVNTHEIPDRLDFDSIKTMMYVSGFQQSPTCGFLPGA